MSGSEAFARVRLGVLDAVRAVPAGFVTTYDAIGVLLDVMPRHVASILATLGDDERETVPWHRVVSKSGAVDETDADRAADQRARLAREGVTCDDAGRIDDFLGRLTAILVVTRRETGDEDPRH